MNLAFTPRMDGQSPKTTCFLLYYVLPLDYTREATTKCSRSTEEEAVNLTERMTEVNLHSLLKNEWDIARKKQK